MCAITLALLPSTALISTQTLAQQVVTQQPLVKQQQFNVPAGPMDQALRSFASQAGINISFKDSLIGNIQSAGLKGSFNIEAGLNALLSDAPLSIKASGNNAYIIEKRNINTLATTQVTDESLGSNTEGTGSYTTGSMASATGLDLSMRETPQSVSVVTSQLMRDQDMRTLTDVVNTHNWAII